MLQLKMWALRLIGFRFRKRGDNLTIHFPKFFVRDDKAIKNFQLKMLSQGIIVKRITKQDYVIEKIL